MIDLQTRIRVRKQILSCRACPLGSSCTSPVPFSGSNPNVYCVVGEAPGEQEDHDGIPFVGKSGSYLRETLESVAGDGFSEAISYVNAVSCYPKRTPVKREIDACKGNLEEQLRAVSPLYVMAVGGIALGALGLPYRMGEAQGRWFWNGDNWILANWHPSAVLRAGTPTRMGKQFVLNCRKWVGTWLGDGREPTPQLTCMRCEEGAVDWEKDGSGWCERHRRFTGDRRPEAKGRKTRDARPDGGYNGDSNQTLAF